MCCGKEICSGCIHAVRLRDKGGLCPFCRSPTPNDEELVKRTKKRMEVGDANAIFNLGVCYSIGEFGLQQDYEKAFKLYHRAGELGYASAYYNVGRAYHFGEGVGRDDNRKYHYFELAAMGGFAPARHNLGSSEACAGNWDRALKHYVISAEGGFNDSVKSIQRLYMNGNATKDDYANALRAYQKYLEEIRSEQRDNAAAYDEGYKYY